MPDFPDVVVGGQLKVGSGVCPAIGEGITKINGSAGLEGPVVVGLIMMVGQAIGAFFGTHYLFKVNPKFIRVLIVAMSFLMLIRYTLSMGWL